jgi:hypothetical protein
MLTTSLPNSSTTAARLTNAVWLAGMIFDVFGAVLATLTARWFDVLDVQHLESLEKIWSASPTTGPRPRKQRILSLEMAIATALFSAFPVVGGGVILFLVGLVIYVWETQPLLVFIISIIPLGILTPLVVVCFYPHDAMKTSIIWILKDKRGAW